MVKNILGMLIRMSVIAVLLFASYYIYTFYTYRAIRMVHFELITIHLIIHYSLFFLIGIVLKLDKQLISAIKKRTLKVNFVKLGIAVVSLMILLSLGYVKMYIPCFVAFLAGYFLIESFECDNTSNKVK